MKNKLLSKRACTSARDNTRTELREPARTDSRRWTRTYPRAFSIGLSCTCLVVSALAGITRADEKANNVDLSAIWNDPTFQKQFIGAYGINADVEPRVGQEEVKILEKIRPLMAEHLPEAEAALVKAMKPDCSALLDVTLGSIQFQREKMADALESYRRAVAKFPSFRRAWRNVGLINARNGQFDDAIRAFTKMIELGGGDSYSYGLLGFAYASKQDYQAAEIAYRNALLLQPENTEWRLGLTRCVFKQDKFEDAAALLDVLIERYPGKSEFWLLQAQTFIGMKQPLRAAENLEALVLLGKANADSLQTLGDIYISENLPDLASRAYLLAIDVDGKQPVARPLREAEMLAARGAFSEARHVATHIHEALDPLMAEADRRKLLRLEARISVAEGIDNSETAAVLEEMVTLDPLDGDALIMLGQYHSRHNQPDRAIFYYERAESIEAVEAKAKIGHAQVLVSMGRYSDAIPLLRRANEIKPRDDIARYLEQVERIAKTRR